MVRIRWVRWLAAAAAVMVLAGCQSMVYKAWETVGVEKRDLLAAMQSSIAEADAFIKGLKSGE